MRTILALIVGLGTAANGLWMILAPFHWYAWVPGVSATGPANVHFIRDIGCAYLVTAVAVFWLMISPPRGGPAAFVAALFLLLHGGMHVWDTVAGRESKLYLLRDVPAVILPGFVILWLIWSYSRPVAPKAVSVPENPVTPGGPAGPGVTR